MKGTQTKVGAASFQGEDVRCEVPRLSGAGSRPPDKLGRAGADNVCAL